MGLLKSSVLLQSKPARTLIEVHTTCKVLLLIIVSSSDLKVNNMQEINVVVRFVF